MARKYLLAVLCTLLPIVSSAQPSTGAEDVISYQGGSWTASCTLSEPISVDDNGSSLTVDGTVAATQSGTWNITNISGTISLPTGAATSANQSTQITSLQLLDDAVATTASAITTKGIAASGTDGTNARILKTDTGGELQIDVLSSALPSGAATSALQTTGNTTLSTISSTMTSLDGKFPDAGQLTDDMSKGDVTQIGAFGMVYDGSTWDMSRGDATNGTLVNLGSNNDVTVTSLVAPGMPGAATTAQTTLLNNTSTTVLSANASRKAAWVTNPTSGVTIWCAENAVAVVGQGAPIFYGGSYRVLSDDAVTCIQNSGSSQSANTVTAQ